MVQDSDKHFYNHKRLSREFKTISAMITIYCQAHHNTDERLCPDCDKLLAYARKRLQRCPFQQDKPTCGNCPIHCYSPVMRQKVKEVMRYAGPRMIYKHPIMALWHLIDGRKKAPELKTKQGKL